MARRRAEEPRDARKWEREPLLHLLDIMRHSAQSGSLHRHGYLRFFLIQKKEAPTGGRGF